MSDAVGYLVLAALALLIAAVIYLARRLGTARPERAQPAQTPPDDAVDAHADRPALLPAAQVPAATPDPEPVAAGADRDQLREEIRDKLRDELLDEVRLEMEDRLRDRAESLNERTARLREREDRVDADRERLIEHEQQLREQDAAIAADREALDAERLAVHDRLETIAGLTADQARDELLATQSATLRRESALLARRIEQEATDEAEQRAKRIVADAIARVASEQTAESTVAVIHLPSDDMKGRIIGREGRNIRAFESTTGVNLIIDDTPEAVLLSCFDPVRREVGRLTLARLVADGRIHPHRIEEAYERSLGEVDEQCRRAAQDAVLEVGIDEPHPALMRLLGRLRYRTSYGQNVLLHLVETAHIAAALAGELGVPAELVKRGAFLHDIGKAVTHERPGSHALIGADLARRHGEPPEVVNAIEAHHGEVPMETIEAVLTQAADACSGGRPGARRESVEAYAERLQRIEQIAAAKEGVERVFAMQAGREVRVMVKPDVVDDALAQAIAREVADEIETELTYPGQIRVTVIRESRATEVAQ